MAGSHPAFFAGLAIFFLSGITFMVILFSNGGWLRSKQFAVIASLARGDLGQTNRRLTFASLIGVAIGMMVTFSGVAAEDAARVRRCSARCVQEGHVYGKIGPSIEMSMSRRNSPAFLACTCSGGPSEPIELHADSL